MANSEIGWTGGARKSKNPALRALTTCSQHGRALRWPISHRRRSVKRCARKAGIEEVDRVSPHTLRHTFTTRLYRETSNIRMVQKALGHSDLSTTMIYTHVVDEELEGAMKGL